MGVVSDHGQNSADIGARGLRFGTDVTDRNGNWRVDAALFAGDYYVRVAKKVVSLASHGKKKKKKKHGGCKGTRSARKRL